MASARARRCRRRRPPPRRDPGSGWPSAPGSAGWPSAQGSAWPSARGSAWPAPRSAQGSTWVRRPALPRPRGPGSAGAEARRLGRRPGRRLGRRRRRRERRRRLGRRRRLLRVDVLRQAQELQIVDRDDHHAGPEALPRGGAVRPHVGDAQEVAVRGEREPEVDLANDQGEEPGRQPDGRHGEGDVIAEARVHGATLAERTALPTSGESRNGTADRDGRLAPQPCPDRPALAATGNGRPPEVIRGSVRGQGDGGATGIRTPDLLNAIQTLFQLSYSPIGPVPDYSGTPPRSTGGRSRTHGAARQGAGVARSRTRTCHRSVADPSTPSGPGSVSVTEITQSPGSDSDSGIRPTASGCR